MRFQPGLTCPVVSRVVKTRGQGLCHRLPGGRRGRLGAPAGAQGAAPKGLLGCLHVLGHAGLQAPKTLAPRDLQAAQDQAREQTLRGGAGDVQLAQALGPGEVLPRPSKQHRAGSG